MEIQHILERDNLFRFDRIYPRTVIVTPEVELPLRVYIQVDESEYLRINGITFSLRNDTPAYKPQNTPAESFELQIKDLATNSAVVGGDQGETANINFPLPQVPVLRLKDISSTYFAKIELNNQRNRQIPGAVTQPFRVRRMFGPKSLIEINLSNFRLGNSYAGFAGELKFALQTTAFRRYD